MTPHSRLGVRHVQVFVVLVLLLSASIACRPSSKASPLPQTPKAQGGQTVIQWPFGQDDGQWTIVNGYRGALDHAPGGSPNDYALFALDFAKCPTVDIDPVEKSCRLTNGWAPTEGAAVYAPVSGTVAWSDDTCHGLSLKVEGHPGFRVALFHIDPPEGTTWSKLAGSAPPMRYARGDRMGTVSSGGCIGSGGHIHMALYSCTECGKDPASQRVGHPFSGQWSIDGCPLDESGVTRGILVPCSNSASTSGQGIENSLAPTPSQTPTHSHIPSSPPLATSVDWRNTTLRSNCADQAPDLSITVHNGTGTAPDPTDPSSTYEFKVPAVALGDLTGDGHPEVAIELICIPPNTNFFVWEIQVLTDGPKRLTRLIVPPLSDALYQADNPADGEFGIESGKLRVGVLFYGPNDCHACGPSIHRALYFRWNGKQLVAA